MQNERHENIESLIKALKEEDKRIRKEIVRVLGEIGDQKAIEPLIHALKDADFIIRWYIAIALGKIGGPAKELLIMALEDEDLKVRLGAIMALGEIGDTKAIEPLIKFLKDENSDIRFRAAEALEKMGWKSDNEKDQLYFLFAKKQWRELKGVGEPAEELLKKALKDEDPTVRRGAAMILKEIEYKKLVALVKSGDKETIEPLIKPLQNEDWESRVRAVEVLDKLGWVPKNDIEKAYYLIAKQKWGELLELGEIAVDVLIKTIEVVDFDDVWCDLIYALGRTGHPKAIELLTRLLKESSEVYIAAGILSALSRIRDEKVVEPLMDGLDYISSTDVDVSGAVLRALGEIGDMRALDCLIWALDSEYDEIRNEAAWALEKMGERGIKALIDAAKDKNCFGQDEAIEALIEIGEPAVELIIKALKEETWFVPIELVEILGEIGDERAIEPIIQSLKIAEEEDRVKIAEALKKIGEPVIKSLIKALKDENEFVRWGVVWVLGEIEDKRAIEHLKQALKDKNGNVRLKAAWVLDKLGWHPQNEKEKVNYLIANRYWDELEELGEVGVESLKSALKDEDWGVRIETAETLGKMKDLKAKEYLIQELQNENKYIRQTVAKALGNIGDTRAIEPLIKALKDEDDRVRMKAAFALDKLGWKPRNDLEKAHHLIVKQLWDELVILGELAIEPLIKAFRYRDDWIIRGAIEALKKIGKASVMPLIKALNHEDKFIRWAAAEALGKFEDKRAVEPLIETLKDREKDVRKKTADVLGILGDKRAVEPLIETLKDENWYVRCKAALALGEIGDERAVEPLRQALKEKNQDVRKAAEKALKKIALNKAGKNKIDQNK